jgi:hypothetical protein
MRNYLFFSNGDSIIEGFNPDGYVLPRRSHITIAQSQECVDTEISKQAKECARKASKTGNRVWIECGNK